MKVVIDYTNWRGERGFRVIEPKSIVFGHNEWHKEPQWLMIAHDFNSGEERSFALLGIHGCAKTTPLTELWDDLRSKGLNCRYYRAIPEADPHLSVKDNGCPQHEWMVMNGPALEGPGLLTVYFIDGNAYGFTKKPQKLSVTDALKHITEFAHV